MSKKTEKSKSTNKATKEPHTESTSEHKSKSVKTDPEIVSDDRIAVAVASKFDVGSKEQKEASSTHSKVEPAYENLGELPDFYETRKCFLAPRDPYHLFAYWDLSYNQIKEYENAAHDDKVFIQLCYTNGHRVQQAQIYPGSRDWHIDVQKANTSFYAEIGYYQPDGTFFVISRSCTATTPPDQMSQNTQVKYVTIPFNFTFRQLSEIILGKSLPGEELADTLSRLQEDGYPFPFETMAKRRLSQGEQHKLLEIMAGEVVRRINMGSFEMTEVLRRRYADLVTSGQWESPGFSPHMSSWFGSRHMMELPEDFFLHVNAELIIYGGTKPGAKVRIDGQEIDLSTDGTFHYHFNYKDGIYHIPVEASSTENSQTRSALLSFAKESNRSNGTFETPQLDKAEPFGKVK
ncbi:MAG: DUF4912 domain-containing protein [Verrucomicrobiota bacterium]